MKLVKIAVAGSALAVAVAFVGIGRPDFARGSSASSRTVTVTGSGTVESVPNRAGLSVGVSTDASTAQASLAANAGKAQKVIDALRAAGVAKTDLQTTDVTVSPRWDDRGRQNGFTAHSSVQVKVVSVARAGAILDAAVAAGATETSGPRFDRSDRSLLYRNALKAAFADAREKAATLAGEAGASLGALQRIEESPGVQPLPLFSARAAGDSATPVEPGTQEVQATVSVTFSLS
jgi:uncharacterized protein YggE